MGRITRKYRQRGGLFGFGKRKPTPISPSVPGTTNSKILTGLDKGSQVANLASKASNTNAASTILGNSANSLSSGFEGLDFTLKALKVAATKKIKHEKDTSDTLKAQSELVAKAATYAHTYLPKILEVAGAVAGMVGVTVIGATPIGAPLIAGALVVLAMYLKQKGLNLKLREIILEHRDKLFSILRMYLIIQRVIINMKVPYVKYNKKTKQSLGEQGLATLQISPEFQEAITEYMLVLKARTPPDSKTAWYKRAYLSTKKFFSAGNTIETLTTLFTKILDSFYLEAAKFNLLIPFAAEEFGPIKNKIKTSSQFTDLVVGFSSTKSSCGDSSDPDAVCNKSDEELTLEFENTINELKTMVPEDQLKRANDVASMVQNGADKIQTETLTDLEEAQADNQQEAAAEAEKQIESTAQTVLENSASSTANESLAANTPPYNEDSSAPSTSSAAPIQRLPAKRLPTESIEPTELTEQNLRRTRRKKYKQRR